jgi:type II secretory pathway component PulK
MSRSSGHARPDVPLGGGPSCRRERRGVALVVALLLLALAAAFLAGAFTSATAMASTARSARATIRAEAAARRAAAELVSAWDSEANTLPVGAHLERALSIDAEEFRMTARARIQRLATRLFVVIVDVRVGEGAPPLAHRRLRLVVERPVSSDTLDSAQPPRPIARWSFGDLY